jgi:hypothetical protein
MRRCLTDLGYALVAVLLIATLYEAAYYGVVTRSLVDISYAYDPHDEDLTRPLVRPKYRFEDDALQPLFVPAHEIDRQVRPRFWARKEYLADLWRHVEVWKP